MKRQAKTVRRIFFGAILFGIAGVGAFLPFSRGNDGFFPKNSARKAAAGIDGTTRPISSSRENPHENSDENPGKEKFSPALDWKNFRFDGNVFAAESAGTREENPTKFSLASGDLYELYGGGREFVQNKSKFAGERDNRIWIDARLPLEVSRRLKIYGVSTLTLGETEYANTLEDYRRSYGFGGGIGVSYRITPAAELKFDFRRTHSLETQGEDSGATDSAGISLKVRF